MGEETWNLESKIVKARIDELLVEKKFWDDLIKNYGMYIDGLNSNSSLDDKISIRIMYMQSQNQKDLVSEKINVLTEKYLKLDEE